MIDEKLLKLEAKETRRLNDDIELIASENYPSQDILDLLGSHFSVKYAEGYPNEVSKQGRHYAGCEVINEVENYAIEKACQLFNCNYANVQPHSGTQANIAVYQALLKPGDTILAMHVDAGGHISHSLNTGFAGKHYNVVTYGLDENGILNYNEIEAKMEEYHPRLLIVGASAYSREIDYERIRMIVDNYNEDKPLDIAKEDVDVESRSITMWTETIEECYMMVDMAHIAGLVATGVHPDPLPYADVVTSTTHKTLRGPRGGLILWNNPNLCSKINSGVFPKTQGGPNEALVAAKAQCFIEALQPSFSTYITQVCRNLGELVRGIKAYDVNDRIGLVNGFPENHMVLLNLRNTAINGAEAEERLKSYGIITNKNMILGDTKPATCSGLRLGTAAITTRGFTGEMCYELGRIVACILLKDTTIKDKVIDFDDMRIKDKISEMLLKVGTFYKPSFRVTVTPINNDNDPA